MSNVASVLRTPVVMLLLVGAGAGCGPAKPQVGGKGTGGTASSDAGTEVGRNAATTVDGARDQGGAVSTGTNLAGCASSGGSSGGGGASAMVGSDGGTKNIPDAGGAGDSKGSTGGFDGGGGSGGGTGGTAGGGGGGGTTGAADGGVPRQMRDGAADQAADDARADGGAGTGGGGSGGNGDGGQPTGDGPRASSDGQPSELGGGSAGDLVPRAGEIEIVELLINPTGTDTGREWVEIVNRSERRLSLTDLHIADLVNEADVEFAAVDGGTATTTEIVLEPGARAVLIQSGDVTKNGGVKGSERDTAGTFGTLVSLNNESETISLCWGACATGILLTRITWDASLGSAYDGHALSIDESGRRCPAATPFGDAGSFGTPFAANPPCP